MTWQVAVSRARRELRCKRPLRAVVLLDRAIEAVAPGGGASARRHAYEISWLRGIALWRAGLPNRALASWIQAAKVEKRSPAHRRVLRLANAYGMVRQASSDADDRAAFFSVQLARYVSQKPTHRLGSHAEIDVVTELIEDQWRSLSTSGVLDRADTDAKLRAFTGITIVFPFLHVPDAWKHQEVVVEFPAGARLSREARCRCASGLPFGICCGRTPGTDEVLAESN